MHHRDRGLSTELQDIERCWKMIVNQLNQGLAGRGHTIQEIQVARRINSGERSEILRQ